MLSRRYWLKCQYGAEDDPRRRRGTGQGPRRALQPRGPLRGVGARRRRRRLGARGGGASGAEDDRHRGAREEHHLAQRLARPRFRPVDQSVPRMRAWVRLLLCPSVARLPRPLARPRLRDPDLREGERRRAAAQGARRAALSLQPDCDRREHRRVPAGRARAPHHALGDRGARRMRASVHADQQERAHRARHRSRRAGGAEAPHARGDLGHQPRRRARAQARAALLGAVPAARGDPAARRRRDPGVRHGRAAHPVRDRPAHGGDPGAREGGRRHVGRLRPAPPAARGRAALQGVARDALSAQGGARHEPRAADERRQGLRLAVRHPPERHRRARGADREALRGRVQAPRFERGGLAGAARHHALPAAAGGAADRPVLGANELQELPAQLGVGEERPAHDAVDHVRLVLHAAPLHAVVVGLEDERHALGLQAVLEDVGELHHRLLLDLRPAHHPVGDARVLRQPDEVRALARQHPDPQLADDRHEVVRAGAAHRDRADDHQLVQLRRVRELGDRRHGVVAALERLVQEHARDAPRGAARVVVALGVDHERLEKCLHALRHLILERLQLGGAVDELGDVVVGVEAAAGGLDPGADAPGGRQQRRGFRVVHDGGPWWFETKTRLHDPPHGRRAEGR